MILAIDTSSSSGSIALLDAEGRLLAERTVGSAGPHARWLLGGIASLLRDHGLTTGDIERYALAIGPGSFTGLRIGVSTIKGLAWSAGRPVTPVCTLRALAMNAPYPGGLVCPILDARKSEVYAAVFASSGAGLRPVMEPSALRPGGLVERIEAARREAPFSEGPVLFLGTGLGVYGDFFEKACAGALLAPEPLWHIGAANIALLALEQGAPAKDPIEIAPLYLRKSEAELNQGAGGAR